MASKTTTDHEEIRKWVEARGGCPAHVKATGKKKRDPGILRIDYEGFSGVDTLEPIEWDDWFSAFDANKLAFVYDTAKKSRFSKLIARPTSAGAKTGAKRTSARRGTTAKRRTVQSAPKKRATTAKKRTTAKRPSKKRASASRSN